MSLTSYNASTGGYATYTCDNGYAIESTELTTINITCDALWNWENMTEACKETCGQPDLPGPNMIYDYVDTGSLIFKGFRVHYECITGYHYGASGVGFDRDCIGVNYWSPFPL